MKIQDLNLKCYNFLKFQVLLDNVQANLPETIPFFICLNGCAEQVFFQVFTYTTWDIKLWQHGGCGLLIDAGQQCENPNRLNFST